MSLNQVELNEIVLDNINQFYNMISVPPVNRHYVEWIGTLQPHDVAIQLNQNDNAFPSTVGDAWKNVWAFKHWYIQKYFGDIVDNIMKITLQPDAFRYYVLRYRNDDGRAATIENPVPTPAPGADIETSPASSNQESQESTDLNIFSNPGEQKEIVPAPFICYHYTEQYEPCKHQCKWCSNKESTENASTRPEPAQISTIAPAPDTLQQAPGENSQEEQHLSAPDHQAADHGSPADQSGQVQRSWCASEHKGAPRCENPCGICEFLPAPGELASAVNKFFDENKPGTNAQE